MSYIKNADIQGNAWVAPGACVVGNVTLGDESSVWYNAVIRGDMAPIVVGCGSNVQDGTVVHADAGFPCEIGNGTSIGHNAIIHGCTIGHNRNGRNRYERCENRFGLYHRGRKSCHTGNRYS